MSHSSTRRGQVEPLAALAATLALVAGVALYSGAYTEALPESPDREVAEPALRQVTEAAATGPIVDRGALAAAAAVGANGRQLNVTLRTADDEWHAGPTAPPDAERAVRPVSVRLPNGTVRPGRLAVEVWP